jgi:NADH-quinone oxidoreductase subunit L
MVAMFFVFFTFGTLNYNEFLPAAASGSVAQTTVTIIAVMLFVGAIGKSAQIPAARAATPRRTRRRR